jgi:AcrR family transcriptional regulator/DNA-binding MarR family transcriptional regulator
MASETLDAAEDGLKRSQVAGVQRSRIVAATFEACAEQGAVGLSVADIVGRAGISRRTFYELFDSCEDCLLAAFDQAVGLASKRVLAAYEPPAPWRTRMRASLTALLRFFDEQPEVARLLVVESLAAGPRALERRSRLVAQMVASVEQGRTAKKGADPPPMTGEGIVGGVLAVLHRHLVEQRPAHAGSSPAVGAPRLVELLNPLMSMVVLPYLGAATARAELERPTPPSAPTSKPPVASLARLDMRLTYRTIRVLMTIAEQPGASNRQIGRVAGVEDPGQISKLLARLHKLGLIENTAPPVKGAANAWTLSAKGAEIQRTIAAQI